MKRVLGQTFIVGALGAIVMAITPACAENNESLFIRAALAPATNRQGGTCTYSNDPTQPALFSGKVDVGVRDSYSSILLVGNQMIPRGDANNTRAESSRVHVNGVVVRVTDPNGGLIGEFTSLATGFIDPQLNNQPSFGTIAATTIDAPTMARIAEGMSVGQSKLVAANVKAFGRSVGGVELETGEFQIPIEVCVGCLVSFSGADDPATPNLDCSQPLPETGGATDEFPCVPGQEEVTPCQLCLERSVCRGEGL